MFDVSVVNNPLSRLLFEENLRIVSSTSLFRLIGLLGALTVALGAFGAHGLERLVTPEAVETFRTGVRYQFYHLLIIAWAGTQVGQPWLKRAVLTRAIACWLGGILLFSGSLYLLSLRDVHGWPVSFLGPITPVGGLLFMVGWGLLVVAPQRGEGGH